jgi:hypothetical protein
MFAKTLACVIVVLFFGTSFGFAMSVYLGENHPPSDLILDGPTHCKVGVKYEWSFVSTDPDGDNITYYVDWGDVCGGAEWHGPYTSGEEVLLAHKYTSKNTLIINAMAVDEHGAESNMTYFEVTISKVRSVQFFGMVLEHFPMLRHLLGR